jgi:hypothetical protein
MKLQMHFGYDGPAKVWADGKEVFFDPEGVNPALPDDAVFEIDGTAGEHQVIIALGSNGGRAWGVFLRCERTDVPKELISKGKEFYKLPEFYV